MTIIHRRWKLIVPIYIVLSMSSSLMAQQKGQYQPGQYGLNAGSAPRSWNHLRGPES